jgi:capsule biosynthesis phosphatase
MLDGVMKRLVFDLDGTIALDEPERPYSERRPNGPLIERLKDYKAQGFEIVIASARNMRTYGGSIGKINANTLPTILAWLEQHGVPYDEIHVGKPWCGAEGFYIDDKAVRPSEFVARSLEEIRALLAAEASA